MSEVVELSILSPHLVVLDVVHHVRVRPLPRRRARVVVDKVHATTLVHTSLPPATTTHQVSLAVIPHVVAQWLCTLTKRIRVRIMCCRDEPWASLFTLLGVCCSSLSCRSTSQILCVIGVCALIAVWLNVKMVFD